MRQVSLSLSHHSLTTLAVNKTPPPNYTLVYVLDPNRKSPTLMRDIRDLKRDIAALWNAILDEIERMPDLWSE